MGQDLGCERNVDKVLGMGVSLKKQGEGSAALPALLTSPLPSPSTAQPQLYRVPSHVLPLLPPVLGSQSPSLLECLQKGQRPLIPHNVAQ